MAARTKSAMTLILKIALAAGLIFYMVQSGHLNLADLYSLLTPFNIAVGVFLVGINIFLAAWRWILLLQAKGFHVPLQYGFSLYLIGLFFNHALPGAIGGDLVKGYYLVADHPDRKMDAALSILIDRVLGLYSFFLLSLMAIIFDLEFVMNHEQIRWVALMCFSIFAAMTLFFLVVFSKRLSRLSGLAWLASHVSFFDRLVVAFQRFGQKPLVIGLSVVVSLLSQVTTMIFFYQLAIVLGEEAITWNAVLFAVPLGFVVTAVPISPAGIGVGQVAFHYLFQIYMNKPTTFGTTAITAFQLSVACYALIGAILYLRRRKPKELEDMAALNEAAPS